MNNYLNEKIREANLSTALTVIRSMGLLTSLLNMIVLVHSGLKKPIYKYLLVMSIADTLYLVSLFVQKYFSLACGRHVSSNQLGSTHCFFYMLFYILLSDYFTSCLAIFNIQMEIFLTLQRIIYLDNARLVRFFKNSFKTVTFILSAWSLCIYSPVLFFKSIKQVDVILQNQTYKDFKMAKSRFGETYTASLIGKSLSLYRILLVTLVLTTLSLVTICKFRKYLNKKASLKKNKRRQDIERTVSTTSSLSRNTTIMLIVISFIYILGNLPHSINQIYKISFDTVSKELSQVSIVCISALIFLKFFVFLTFNFTFRKHFILCLTKASRIVFCSYLFYSPSRLI